MILKCSPQLVEKIWGDESLGRLYSVSSKIGEVWLCSNHPSYTTPLFNDKKERIEWSWVNDKWGFKRFPFLIKHIKTTDWLSVQVHPDDEAAQKAGELWGKPEMWYFINGGKIINGLKKGALEKIKKGDRSWESLLSVVEVKSGEAMYISPGTVHAMGPNVEVYEFQLTSDMTYRLYDWGRGRKTHLEEALNVARESISEPFEFKSFASSKFKISLAETDKFIDTKGRVVYLAEKGNFAGKGFKIPTVFVNVENGKLNVTGRVLKMEVPN